MGFKADVAALTPAAEELARDQGDLVVQKAAVAAKEQEIADDEGAISAANDKVSADLVNGPKFILRDDGTIDLYQHADTPLGFTITNIPPAD